MYLAQDGIPDKILIKKIKEDEELILNSLYIKLFKYLFIISITFILINKSEIIKNGNK